MDLFILICIGAINVMTLVGVYRSLKDVPARGKIAFLAVGFGGIYLLVSGLYYLSTLGLNIQGSLGETQQFITFTFVPVNATISLVFLARNYSRLLAEQTTKEKFQKVCIRVLLILVVAMICEYFYFRSVNQSIIEMALSAKGA